MDYQGFFSVLGQVMSSSSLWLKFYFLKLWEDFIDTTHHARWEDCVGRAPWQSPNCIQGFYFLSKILFILFYLFKKDEAFHMYQTSISIIFLWFYPPIHLFSQSVCIILF